MKKKKTANQVASITVPPEILQEIDQYCSINYIPRTSFFVKAANATAIYLATTPGGAVITLTAGSSETGHGLQGNTATAAITVAGGETRGIAHTGWVKRTEGTGGRAGRVSYEVLVAGSMSSDASDDSILPDS